MISINRKGQSLVLFVILIPILLGIMAFVIDVGNASFVKKSTDDVILMVIDVAIDSDNSNIIELERLMNYNLVDNKNSVKIIDGDVTVESSVSVEGIFSKLFGIHLFNIHSEYVGRVVDGKKEIVKIR